MTETVRFEFGKNWRNFLDFHFDEESLREATDSLKTLLLLDNLNNKIFLDMGCGSGIFSLAAFRLGAEKIISVDRDEEAVKCCQSLREQSGNPANWTIKQGSLIDDDFIGSLEKADIVYCWGVAHHTGEMWHGLDNLSKLLNQNGLLAVSVYNKVTGFFGSENWLKIKSFYNRSHWLIKKLMEISYIAFNFLKILLHFKNPLTVIANYKRKRGMSWKTDLIDWLGGFPYEYAAVKEVFDFYHQKHGLELVNIKTTNFLGNNQFVFRKT